MKSFFHAILHSYSLLFFSQHRGFAALLVLVTFAHPWAGVAGLGAAALAVGGARLAGFNRELTDLGAYSFNSLLVGLALSALYEPGWALLGLVAVGAGLALLLSVALGGWLAGRGLPPLSLPFVAVLWLVLPVAARLPQLGLSERGIYWLNEVYALGGAPLVTAVRWVGEWPWPPLLGTYLRALSSVLLQDSALGGLLVAAGLLWHSRIAFTLSGLAFLGAYGFALLTGTLPGESETYNLGANYMMTAIAVGAVFVVPSAASYGLALGSVPVTAVLLTGLSTLLAKAGLPVFSLPFCAAALLFLYVLLLRERPGPGLVLTPVQRYSPERNLYAYRTDRIRLAHQLYFPLTLPFLGEWRCSQGYHDNNPTHAGDWGQALDFVVADADGRTYANSGLALTDYYAYNKPILAPADGLIEEVIQHLADNPIGEVNLRQNWGNTVVIRHAPGLYTQLSHLRPHSVPLKPGDAVRRGDIIGYCGSSGRSPEPHLHLQVQATPYVGSRTLAYPLAYFLEKKCKTNLPDRNTTSRTKTRPPGPKHDLPDQNTTFRTDDTTFRTDNTTFRAETHPSASQIRPAVSQTRSAASQTPASASQTRPPALQNHLSGTKNLPPAPHSLSSHPQTPARETLRHFTVPAAGDTVSAPAPSRPLTQALHLPPGFVLTVELENLPIHSSTHPKSTHPKSTHPESAHWEVFTDAYNLTYLRCHHTGATAYFEHDEATFYFTAYYGPETTWLYYFYQAAYRVPLINLPAAETTDIFPLSILQNPALQWAQDLVAPFYHFITPAFSLHDMPGNTARQLRLHSRAAVRYFGREHLIQEAELLVQENRLAGLTIRRAGQPELRLAFTSSSV